MRPVLVFLAAVVLAAGCSARPAAKASPTVTATPTAAATLSTTDRGSAQLACFGWTTYNAGKKAGNENTTSYATTAQQPTQGMSDPRWSRVADLPTEEAMRVLGGLCAEIHYHE